MNETHPSYYLNHSINLHVLKALDKKNLIIICVFWNTFPSDNKLPQQFEPNPLSPSSDIKWGLPIPALT